MTAAAEGKCREKKNDGQIAELVTLRMKPEASKLNGEQTRRRPEEESPAETRAREHEYELFAKAV